MISDTVVKRVIRIEYEIEIGIGIEESDGTGRYGKYRVVEV